MPEEQTDPAQHKISRRSNVPAWVVSLGIIVIAGGIFLVVYGDWNRWESDRSEQSTNDAYVKADLTAVSTKASGLLARLDVTDYQHLDSGQLIATIRDDDYKAQVEAAQAALKAAEAGLPELQQQKGSADSKIAQAKAGVSAAESQIVAAQASVGAAETSVRVAEAQLSSARAIFENASQDVARQEALYPEKATTLQKLQSQQAQTKSARAALDAAELGVATAKAQLDIRRADSERAKSSLEGANADGSAAASARRLLDAKGAEILADIAARRAALDSAIISASYTIIKAPAEGYVASRNVLPGQMVTPGTTVISLIEQAPWIQANYKETQLTFVRAGDPAEIRVDTFPDRRWNGRVLAISPATGAQTALIGPDNATGNFTKIVQRIPVKVALDASQDLSLLRPGMSAVVTIRPNKGSGKR